ncbi:S9 family peptidase [Brevibacillus agri]|uniref:S9 family peptidase n=1 Tax=Brevibacillus agri TaxID=51101 RepID=UPI0002A4CF8A|nr:S9 family peptidase [Brevibacillus agri]ELK42540.1 peptidase [Brevibacillus agri BAB-2500]MBG9564538.1 peptidase [Brevibacillus agri]MDN4091221.1 S9 family peptidase [Brevibacillus agri]MDR9503733.1 S9 family peptidase [Brevibacillus agri]MED4573058.1 S9 family peptidase [Brevibacillus agri]
MTKRGMTAEDLYQLKYASDPQLSPDGRTVVYVETSIDEEHAYRNHLYVRELAAAEPRALTTGAVRDTYPRWSPDGSQLSFVSKRSGTSQVWLMDATGGEPRQLTFCKAGASTPIWSPDGRYIAFSALLDRGETFHDREGEGEKKATAPKVIHVERMKYKSDDHGYLYEKTRQLALVDVQSGEITALTDGPYHHTVGSWSPDGQWLAITANRTENPDMQHSLDVYLIPIAGGEWKKLTSSNGTFFYPTWSADGKKLAYIGSVSETYLNATQKKVWVYDLESGQQTCVTADWDVQIGDSTIGDVRSPGHPNPGAVWTEDGSALYVIVSERGNSGIYRVSLGGEATRIVGGNRNVYGFTFHEQQQTVIAAISDPLIPGDLYQIDLATGAERRLTELNRDFFADVELSVPEEIEFTAQDGWNVHGWILKPVGYQPGEKYPLVLQIHGGPHSMYGNTFFHEFQLLAAKGYAVLYTNPRGSFGYGERFMQACCGDYGGKDYLDLMSAVDYACAQFDFVDESRLGVAGGSYGGLMTNWIVGQTNRFKAGVTDRSICNWMSFYGVSDIGYYFSAEEIQANPFTNPEKMWHHSPIRLVANMETPLLIMHGEQDHRCPIDQAEQLYITLKHQGKAPVSFVRFPGASHELSRSGDPEQRVLRLQYTADWFATYMEPKVPSLQQ